MKKDIKIISNILMVSILVIGALLLLVSYLIFGSSYTFKGLDEIEKGHCIFSDDFLSYVCEYEDAYYQLHHENIAVFSSDASVLILNFSPENYQNEKDRIEKDYIFLNTPVADESGDYLISENIFSIDDWNFRVCRSDGWTTFSYPDYFRMVGYNEAENKIAYLDFDDSDLDVINEPMADFISSYFDYDFRNE